jgi:hypothetical protein
MTAIANPALNMHGIQPCPTTPGTVDVGIGHWMAHVTTVTTNVPDIGDTADVHLNIHRLGQRHDPDADTVLEPEQALALAAVVEQAGLLGQRIEDGQ